MISIFGVVSCLIVEALGGGLRRGLRNARYLSTSGFEVCLLTFSSNADSAFQEAWGATIEPVCLPHDPRPADQDAWLLREALRRACERPVGQRLLLTGGTRATWRVIGTLLAARLCGVPTLYDSSMFPDPLPQPVWRRGRAWLVTHFFFRCHQLVACQTKAQWRCYERQFRIPRQKLWFSPNGVDCKRFQPATPDQRTQARRRWQIPSGALVAITVANVVPRKGIDLLVAAWRRVLDRHPTAHLIIAGTLGSRPTAPRMAAELDRYAHEMRSLIQSLPRPESVRLLGHVDDVESLHHAADVFVFGSRQEGLPNVLLEAMASGLPCLTCRYAGFPLEGEELGFENRTFLTAERSPEAFASIMNTLLEDAALRRHIGQAARDWVVKTQDLGVIHPAIAARLRALAASVTAQPAEMRA
jgi:glycosyltransferase involved in cell wall biosynthesis